MSASPFLSIATRVLPSDTLFMISRFTEGTRRQWPVYASSTTSTPGVWLTYRYGPAPIGCLRKASSPTCVRYLDRKSTRLNSSHLVISYAVFCLKKKKKNKKADYTVRQESESIECM